MSPLVVPERHASVRPTTWISPERLEDRLGLSIRLASETFQRTGSFKFRAAYHFASLAEADHLIAASSGNFGQALALASRMLGKRATIVMPHRASRVKIEAVKAFGGRVVLTDTDREPRRVVVDRLVKETPSSLRGSGYDADAVITGNSTLGVEIGERLASWDADRRRRAVVVVPVGGGGISSGIVLGLRHTGCPDVPVVGAEPLLANDAARSRRRGERVALDVEPQTLADGARVLSLGVRNWAILRGGLAGIVEVPEPQIAEGLRLLFHRANLKAEPTGALGIGALLTEPDRFAGKEVVVVVTGGNVDPGVYTRILGGASTPEEVYR